VTTLEEDVFSLFFSSLNWKEEEEEEEEEDFNSMEEDAVSFKQII
jgi:hypothetical protein